MNQQNKIAIVGGGMSGLAAAFELSEDANLDITVIEASDACGGKMKGYFNQQSNTFEEHSIRALSSTYFALFDIFSRAEMLHTLSPVDSYLFYESKTGKRVAIDRTDSIKFDALKELISTFDLSVTDMLTLAKKITHHVNASDDEREKQKSQSAGDVIGIEDFSPRTKQFIVNWFGILTGARMESKAVDIMDSFVLMFLPMLESPNLPEGKKSKSYCFDRPTSEVIKILVDKLHERGVKFQHNARLENYSHNAQTNAIQLKTSGQNLEHLSFDACIFAIPHEVMWKLGLLSGVKKAFNDEWSFGTQFPMASVPSVLQDFTGKTYNLSFDSPWNIVFQIQHQGSFWKDVAFPKDYPYNLSATCSSPFNEGALYNKRFMQCTPLEAKHEILFQLGVTDEQHRNLLVEKAVVDSVYLDYTDDWQKYATLETAEMGILQSNQKRWVDLSQIYVRSAHDQEITVNTDIDSIFLAGEVVSVPGRWKIPTMEQAAMSGKQAAQQVFNYLHIDKQINMEYATLTSTKKYTVLEGILAGLNGLAKLVPHKKA